MPSQDGANKATSQGGDADLKELEALFAGRKRRRKTPEKVKQPSERSSRRAPRPDREGRLVRGQPPATQRSRRTAEGYRVYSWEEHVADQPGDLPSGGKCPFDCNCCF